MTAPIDHRGNDVLKLAEDLRQRRALKWGVPEGGQIVDGATLDEAIAAIVALGHGAGKVTDAELARFIEAWTDK